MAAVDDPSAPGARSFLGTDPRLSRIVASADRSVLDGEEIRVVLELGELTWERCAVAGVRVLAVRIDDAYVPSWLSSCVVQTGGLVS